MVGFLICHLRYIVDGQTLEVEAELVSGEYAVDAFGNGGREAWVERKGVKRSYNCFGCMRFGNERRRKKWIGAEIVLG